MRYPRLKHQETRGSPDLGSSENILTGMSVYIGLLRAVNVGGRTLKMQALRELCASVGLQDVCTHLQSGNFVFKTKDQKPAAIAAKLETALEREFGFRAEVILRTTAELKQVMARNPFAKRREVAPNKLIVMFLRDELQLETRKAIEALDRDGEELVWGGREIYMYFPEGMGQSKFVPRLMRSLKNSGTARNWNTVTKVLEIAEGMEK